MSKSIPSSGANAVKLILKNKEAFKCYLKNQETTGNITTYSLDVFYEDHTGTFTIRVDDTGLKTASLNITGLKKVITLENDGNLPKLCKYVLDNLNQ